MAQVLLKIKHIEKWYEKTRVLNDITFDINKGEVLSLLGVNGAGKTTLSSIITSLHPPTNGDIMHNGISIYEDIPSYRRLIGYCPQKPNLHPMLSMEDNLKLAGRCFGMTDQQIEDRMHELDQQLGINEYKGHMVFQLSGGWKQRYVIARALMHSPKLVILDEPTVALDPSVRYQLWNLIKDMRQSGIAILLTTHYLEEAEQLSDRVCLLDKGEVKLIDTPANLKIKFKKERLEDVFVQLTQKAQ